MGHHIGLAKPLAGDSVNDTTAALLKVLLPLPNESLVPDSLNDGPPLVANCHVILVSVLTLKPSNHGAKVRRSMLE